MKVCFISLICTQLCLLSFVSSHSLVNMYELANKHINLYLPKYWSNYIDKAFHSGKGKAQFHHMGRRANGLSVVDSIMCYYHSISCLKRKSETLVRTDSYETWILEPLGKVVSNYSKPEHLLKYVYAFIAAHVWNYFTKGTLLPLKDHAYREDCPTWRWTFSLNSNFQLNLTFDYVYFSSIDMNPCSFGHIQVRMIHPMFEHTNDSSVLCELTWIEQKNPFNTTRRIPFYQQRHFYPGSISLCGIHGKTPVFSPYQTTYVMAYYVGFVVHKTSVSFSIMDSHLYIKSFQHKNQFFTCNPKNFIQTSTHIMFGQMNVAEHTFLLHVRKNQRIFLRSYLIKVKDIHIHDGPGTLSKLLYPILNTSKNQIMYQTTTFQCFVSLFHGGFELYKNNMTFLHENIEATRVLFVEATLKKTIVYPGLICSLGPLCIIRINTEKDHHINFTINYMRNSKTVNTACCSFAGVSAYDGETDHLTHCPKGAGINRETRQSGHVVDEYKFPSIFSSQHFLELILYNYERYSSLIFESHISTTQCVFFAMNACTHGESQDFLRYMPSHVAQQKKVLTHLPENGCVIVQLFSSFAELAEYQHKNKTQVTKDPIVKCHIKVGFNYSKHWDRVLMVNASGFFRSEWHA